MWGKQNVFKRQTRGNRIIPTGVGKTFAEKNMIICKTDHPHGCGENIVTHCAEFDLSGSSPRVWGKPRQCRCEIVMTRIIPTGVGKTLIITDRSLLTSDHPHGCGENDVFLGCNLLRCGSSPRVWGKPAQSQRTRSELRIIPTGVGKTRALFFKFGLFPDHPHGCGENFAFRF